MISTLTRFPGSHQDDHQEDDPDDQHDDHEEGLDRRGDGCAGGGVIM